MFRPTHLRNYNMNFGHLFIDDILSTYIAMQVACRSQSLKPSSCPLLFSLFSLLINALIS